MKNIKTKYLSLIIISILLVYCNNVQAQIQLKTWTQVYGTVNGENLGKYVNSIPPNINFPYRAIVSVGEYYQGNEERTNVYTLSSPTDTSIKATFTGTNMLVGDLNDDGYVDLVVKTKTAIDTFWNPYDTVRVYWGTPTGVDTLNPLKIPAGEMYRDLYPAAIADISNDGKPDLILSAPYYQNRGRIYIYLNPVTNPIPDYIITGGINKSLGIAVVTGDLNNDSFIDLIIVEQDDSNPTDRHNNVKIYYGVGLDTINTTLGQQFRSNSYGQRGLACFDTNGDGIDDLLYPDSDSLSAIYIHYGKESLLDTIPNLKLQNPGVGDFGSSVINAGDMNGDGYDDIAVTAPHATYTSGYVFIYGGGPDIDEYFDAGKGISLDSRFGTSIASLGDINGDGLSDIIVGAPEYDFGNDKGYWGVLLGDTNIEVTDVKPEDILNPEGYQLYQNYPNPFNPTTVISYRLAVLSQIKITIYDELGKEITVLIDEEKPAGRYEIEFDASKYKLSNGIYICTLRCDGGIISNKIIYLK